MPFPKKLLNPDEEVILDLRPHWLFFFEPIITGVLAIIGLIVFSILFNGGWLNKALNWVALGAILVALGWALWRFSNWFTTYFVITSDRLIYRSGVIQKRGIQIPLERVNNVIFTQNVFERMLKAGDLVIESAGESGRQVFEDVKHPDSVQNVIYQVMEQNENRKFDRMGNSAAAGIREGARDAGFTPASMGAVGGAGAVGGVGEELERLEGLLHRGTITQAEFDRQKAKVLGSLPPPA